MSVKCTESSNISSKLQGVNTSIDWVFNVQKSQGLPLKSAKNIESSIDSSTPDGRCILHEGSYVGLVDGNSGLEGKKIP